MTFENINLVHVLIAGIAAWILGAVYYTLLGKQYGAAMGATPQEMEACRNREHSKLPFVLALIGAVLMSYILAALLTYVASGAITVRDGVISAFFVWLGFTMPPIAINNAFAQRKGAVTIIDAVYWLLALLLEGALLGAFASGTIKLPF